MHDESPPTPPRDERATDTGPQAGSCRLRSEDLFRGVSEVVIEHNGRQYQLRITQNGKLILTA